MKIIKSSVNNRDILEGMYVSNGSQVWKVITWDEEHKNALLQKIDKEGRKTDDYVVAENYELYGDEKDPQISWMNGNYVNDKSLEEAKSHFKKVTSSVQIKSDCCNEECDFVVQKMMDEWLEKHEDATAEEIVQRRKQLEKYVCEMQSRSTNVTSSKIQNAACEYRDRKGNVVVKAEGNSSNRTITEVVNSACDLSVGDHVSDSDLGNNYLNNTYHGRWVVTSHKKALKSAKVPKNVSLDNDTKKLLDKLERKVGHELEIKFADAEKTVPYVNVEKFKDGEVCVSEGYLNRLAEDLLFDGYSAPVDGFIKVYLNPEIMYATSVSSSKQINSSVEFRKSVEDAANGIKEVVDVNYLMQGYKTLEDRCFVETYTTNEMKADKIADKIERNLLDKGIRTNHYLKQYYELSEDSYEDLDKRIRDTYAIVFEFLENDEIESSVDIDKLWEIADRYNTSKPVSGDWNTETEHELNAISKELGISKQEAKNLMIRELGFDDSMFGKTIKSSFEDEETIDIEDVKEEWTNEGYAPDVIADFFDEEELYDGDEITYAQERELFKKMEKYHLSRSAEFSSRKPIKSELSNWVDPRSKVKGWKVKVLDVYPDTYGGNTIAKVELFDPDGNFQEEDNIFIHRQDVKIGETYDAYVDGLMAMPRIIGVKEISRDEVPDMREVTRERYLKSSRKVIKSELQKLPVFELCTAWIPNVLGQRELMKHFKELGIEEMTLDEFLDEVEKMPNPDGIFTPKGPNFKEEIKSAFLGGDGSRGSGYGLYFEEYSDGGFFILTLNGRDVDYIASTDPNAKKIVDDWIDLYEINLQKPLEEYIKDSESEKE